MKQNLVFTILGIIVLMISMGIVIRKQVPEEELQQFFKDGSLPASIVAKTRRGEEKTLSTEDHSLDYDGDSEDLTSVLAPVDESVNSWDDLLIKAGAFPRLKEIPWTTYDIEKVLRRYRGTECALIRPGTDVYPLPEVIGSQEHKVTSIRKNAVVVGLKLDRDAESSLPRLTKGPITDYLNNHLLAIQATVFKNQEGEMTFAGPVQAAFVAKGNSSQTIAPESMINDAVKKIRLLGALSHMNDAGDLTARTLVLSFMYERETLRQEAELADRTFATKGPSTQNDYELLFLHLPNNGYSSVTEPVIVAFATTEGRTKFHQIEALQQRQSMSANVNANIKFKEFRLAGQYPASPVVTDVKTRSSFSTDLDVVKSRITGEGGLDPVDMGKLLDELYQASLTKLTPPRR